MYKAELNTAELAQEWQMRLAAFLASDKKENISLRLSEDFKEYPPAREWALAYLQTPEARQLKYPALPFLLGFFKGEHVTRQEVEVVMNEYLLKDDMLELHIHDDVFAVVVHWGSKFLTDEEKKRCSERTKEYFIEAVKRSDPSNTRFSLINMIHELEGTESLEWLLEQIKSPRLYQPAFGLAVNSAYNYDPKRTIEAMTVHLRAIDPDYLFGRVVCAQSLAGNAGWSYLTAPQDRKLYAEAIAMPLLAVEGDEQMLPFYKEWTIELIKTNKEEVRVLVDELPKGSKEREAIEQILQ